MSRFTLDEDKAREWIARVIDANEGLAPTGPGLPDGILSTYGFGVDSDYGSETSDLVLAAFAAGILADTGQPEDQKLFFDFVPHDGEECGYHWALYLDGTGGLAVRSLFSPMRRLGDSSGQDLGGAELAVAVLREAAEAGNQIAAGVAAYVAQEAGR